MKNSILLSAFTVLVFGIQMILAPQNVLACPRSAAVSSLPLGIASTPSSSISFTISNKGVFKVTRTLASDVPTSAVSCLTSLQARFSRKLSYSTVKTLVTVSSRARVLSITSKRLQSVKREKFRGNSIQPSLHLRAVTDCVDTNGNSVLSDTTPVVARYVECGFSKEPVSMGTFVKTLTRKLANKYS